MADSDPGRVFPRACPVAEFLLCVSSASHPVPTASRVCFVYALFVDSSVTPFPLPETTELDMAEKQKRGREAAAAEQGGDMDTARAKKKERGGEADAVAAAEGGGPGKGAFVFQASLKDGAKGPAQQKVMRAEKAKQDSQGRPPTFTRTRSSRSSKTGTAAGATGDDADWEEEGECVGAATTLRTKNSAKARKAKRAGAVDATRTAIKRPRGVKGAATFYKEEMDRDS